MKPPCTHPPAADLQGGGLAPAPLHASSVASYDDTIAPAKPRFIRLPAVEPLTGLKKSAIYALMKNRQFPQSIKISTRCVAWNEQEVLDWMRARIAKPQEAPQGVIR